MYPKLYLGLKKWNYLLTSSTYYGRENTESNVILDGYIKSKLPSYCEQSTFAMNVFLAVPGISLPVTVLTHQHEAADGLHCLALKLPSSLQSGL